MALVPADRSGTIKAPGTIKTELDDTKVCLRPFKRAYSTPPLKHYSAHSLKRFKAGEEAKPKDLMASAKQLIEFRMVLREMGSKYRCT